MLSPYSAMNCSSVIFFFESKYFQIAAVISAMMEPANEVIERISSVDIEFLLISFFCVSDYIASNVSESILTISTGGTIPPASIPKYPAGP